MVDLLIKALSAYIAMASLLRTMEVEVKPLPDTMHGYKKPRVYAEDLLKQIAKPNYVENPEMEESKI
jgi:hypothetical protein